jgi:hypothetical protein
MIVCFLKSIYLEGVLRQNEQSSSKLEERITSRPAEKLASAAKGMFDIVSRIPTRRIFHSLMESFPL